MTPVPVTVRASCRVDLAGGTFDIWPLGLLHPGARTINMAIDLPIAVRLAASDDGAYRVYQKEEMVASAATATELSRMPEGALVGQVAEALDLPPLDASLESASPRGGGLGASSALVVALIRAGEIFGGLPRRPPGGVVALARDLEARMMSLPTGTQDHWAALMGGLLEIRHQPGGEELERIPVDLSELGDRLLVAYSGQSHFSAASNWQVVRRRLDGDEEMVARFEALATATRDLSRALGEGDLAEAGRAMGREWQARRTLAPGVSTPPVERILEAAVSAGAWGGKVCGAGGGGSVAVLAPVERRPQVREAIQTAGGELLATRPTAQGLRVETRAQVGARGTVE